MKLECINYKHFPEKNYGQRCVHFALGIVTSLFCLLPITSIAEENTCTGLKKVNNLDELLYQIYTNLDSDCLFTMPLAELEEAWNIKILSEERLQPDQKLSAYPALRDSADFHGKPYHSEIDAFYIEADRNDDRTKRFIIAITEAYYQKHLTLFPEGNYPRLLPAPIEKLRMPPIHYEFPLDGASPRYPQNPGKYNSDFFYLWLNTDRTRMIYLPAGLGGSVVRIVIYDEIPSAFSNDITE